MYMRHILVLVLLSLSMVVTIQTSWYMQDQCPKQEVCFRRRCRTGGRGMLGWCQPAILGRCRSLVKQQGAPLPTVPVVFFKPTTAYIKEGEKIQIPPKCEDLHYEVELGVVIGQEAKNIPEERAMDVVAGYTLCLDMTAWDFARVSRELGQPWGLAKGFDTACPVSQFVSKDKIPDTSDVRLWLKLNDKITQDSSTDDMIFSVPEVISYVSQYFRLEPGDVILTGSPAGQGPVISGDKIVAGIDVREERVVTMKFEVE